MKNLKLVITLSICALAFACSDDPEETNNGNTNNGQTTNNGKTSNNGTTAANNGTTGANNGATTAGPGTTAAPAMKACEGANPPARCAEDPNAFVWGAASVLTKLEIAADEECCFDYTGDGNFNNVLGSSLEGFGALAGMNTSIAENIASGELAPILEHDGLTALDADGNYIVNFFLGSHADANFSGADPAGGNKVLIDPASIDAGTQPLALLPGASLTNATGKVKAGPGAIALDFNLLGTELNLVISNANIEADLVVADSEIGAKGIALSGGKLGGLVKVSDVYGAVNNVAATCGCLELAAGTALISDGVCNADAVAKEQACTDNGEDSCATIAGACGNLALVGLLKDAESTPGAGLDSLSLGATIEAVGAEITGLE